MLLAGEREANAADKTLAAGRKEVLGAAIDRLRGLVPHAVDCVEEQLAECDAMAPFRVLRLAAARPPSQESSE